MRRNVQFALLIGVVLWSRSAAADEAGRTDAVLVSGAPTTPEVIHLGAYVLDPARAKPALPAPLQYGPTTLASAAALPYVVQLYSPIPPDWRARLEAAQARVPPLAYLGDNAVLARMTTDRVDSVRALSIVRSVSEYEPAYKADPDLLARAGRISVTLAFFPDVDRATAGEGILQAGGEIVEESERTDLPIHVIRVSVSATALQQLLQNTDLVWATEYIPPRLHNDFAAAGPSATTNGLNARSVWPSADPGGSTLGLSINLDGTGQVVDVADTGLDTGSIATVHCDFLSGGAGCSDAARVLGGIYYGPGRSGCTNTTRWCDPDGHGTHTAGSIFSNGNRSVLFSSYTGQPVRGMAYRARGIESRIFNQAGGWVGPANDSTIFNDAYSGANAQCAACTGARVFSNSWGGPTATPACTDCLNSSNFQIYRYGDYTTEAADVDNWLFSHQNTVIAFSAGNEAIDEAAGSGDGLIDYLDSANANVSFKNAACTTQLDTGANFSTIGTPGTAKNVITVGAAENDRSSMGANPFCIDNLAGGFFYSTWMYDWGCEFGTAPVATDYMATHTTGLAAFSSRGLTADYRIKPDIVAPGTHVLSTKSSRAPSANFWGLPSYAYTCTASSAGSATNYYNPGGNTTLDTYYAFDGGTSMACPLTAGAATLLRQWVTDKGFADTGPTVPIGPLVKALMANGARNLYPGQYGTASATQEIAGRPDGGQGWGEVDVLNTLYPAYPATLAYQTGSFPASNTSCNGGTLYSVKVTSSAAPLSATLAWYDAPGTAQVPTTSARLVNQLILLAYPPGSAPCSTGTVYAGNVVDTATGLRNRGQWTLAQAYTCAPSCSFTSNTVDNLLGVRVQTPAVGTWTLQVLPWSIVTGPQPYALVSSAVTSQKWAVQNAGMTLQAASLRLGSGVYSGFSDNAVRSFSQTDGSSLWASAAPLPNTPKGRAPAVSIGGTDYLFVADQGGNVTCLRASDGVQQWSVQPGGVGSSAGNAPSVYNSGNLATSVVFVTISKTATTSALYALNASSGATYWFYGNGSPNIDMMSSRPALDYSRGMLYFTSRANGGSQPSIWAVDFGHRTPVGSGATGDWSVAGQGDIDSSPSLSSTGGTLYVGTNAGLVKAINVSTHAITWTYTTGVAGTIYGAPWVDGTTIYVSQQSSPGRVWSLVDGGASVSVNASWKNGVGDAGHTGWVAVSGPSFPVVVSPGGTKMIYVGSADGHLYQLSPVDGHATAVFACRSAVGDPGFDLSLGRLYFGTSDGRMHSLDLSSGGL